MEGVEPAAEPSGHSGAALADQVDAVLLEGLTIEVLQIARGLHVQAVVMVLQLDLVEFVQQPHIIFKLAQLVLEFCVFSRTGQKVLCADSLHRESQRVVCE